MHGFDTSSEKKQANRTEEEPGEEPSERTVIKLPKNKKMQCCVGMLKLANATSRFSNATAGTYEMHLTVHQC